MPVNYHYAKDNDRYAQLYRLQELLRLKLNKGLINHIEHEKLENVILTEILKIRTKLKNDMSINANLTDITL